MEPGSFISWLLIISLTHSSTTKTAGSPPVVCPFSTLVRTMNSPKSVTVASTALFPNIIFLLLTTGLANTTQRATYHRGYSQSAAMSNRGVRRNKARKVLDDLRAPTTDSRRNYATKVYDRYEEVEHAFNRPPDVAAGDRTMKDYQGYSLWIGQSISVDKVPANARIDDQLAAKVIGAGKSARIYNDGPLSSTERRTSEAHVC